MSESAIWNQHINKRQANWAQTFIGTQSIGDAISYLDLGSDIPRELFTFDMGKGLALSYADEWDGYYKIAGMTIFRNSNEVVIVRSTYDILAFLGDVGGLEGILLIIGGILVGWFADFSSTGYFMPLLFHSQAKADHKDAVAS